MAWMFGPADATLENAPFQIQFRVLVLHPESPELARARLENTGVPIVGLHERAVVWSKPSIPPTQHLDRFQGAVIWSATKINPSDDVQLESIILRPYADETDKRSLVYYPPPNPNAARLAAITSSSMAEQAIGGQGYFQMIYGKKYYLNVTYGAGSSIAQNVGGKLKWRPHAFLLKSSSDAKQPITSRRFAQFVTNWAQGTEVRPPDALERLWLSSHPDLTAESAQQMELKRQESKAGPSPLSLLSPNPQKGEKINLQNGEKAHFSSLTDQQRQLIANYTKPYADDIRTTLVDATRHLPWDNVDLRFPLERECLADDGTPLDCPALPHLDDRRFKLFVELPNGNMLLPPSSQELACSLQTTFQFLNQTEWPLGFALNALEMYCRWCTTPTVELTTNQKKLVTMARVILSLFAVWEALPGWLNAARFMDAVEPKHAIHQKSLQSCLEIAESLLFRLCHRIAWILTCARCKTSGFGQESATDTILRILSADRLWLQSASGFMSKYEMALQKLLQVNPMRFCLYRDTCAKGMPWPHPPELQKQLNAIGWTFKPTMLKRDRMICTICQAEKSGWRSWHTPYDAHDWSKHPVESIPWKGAFILKPSSESVTKIIWESAFRLALVVHSLAPDGVVAGGIVPAVTPLHAVHLPVSVANDQKRTNPAAVMPGHVASPRNDAVAAGQGDGALHNAPIRPNATAQQTRVFESALGTLDAYQRQQQQLQSGPGAPTLTSLMRTDS